MKCPWLRLFLANCFDLGPFSLIYIKLMDVVESLLVCVNSSEDVYLVAANYCWVAVPRLRGRTVGSVNFVPVVRKKTVLENVIHGIVAIPTSKDEHRVLKHHCWVPKSIKRLYAITLYLLPFVLFVFDATFVHVSKPLLAVITPIHKQPSIPKHNCMISPLAWHLSTLQRPHIKPLLLLQIIIE